MFIKKLKNILIKFLNLIIILNRRLLNRYKVYGKTKYFCIGRNKTGTTSLKKAFEELGYIVGDQRTAERLYDQFFFENKFSPIIEYCKSYEVFQDVPFSHYATIEHIDKAFPGSKFILTIRDDAEQWYRSITEFHAKMFGFEGRVPTVEDLRNATYIRKGFMYNTVKSHGTTDDDPYNKKIMIDHYRNHNYFILNYFKDRPDDLLVINISEKDSYSKFVKFLNIYSPYNKFPWENKT